MIQRTFHPIGQGAFYSERHKGINIVYDCGNQKASKLADKIIRQSFDSDEEIDILFISHFDFDHISKLSTLKNHVSNIKRVVLPLLHESEKFLLSVIYGILNFDISTLINEPQQYFGDKTKIIYVEGYEKGKNAEISNNEPFDIDSIEPDEKDNTLKIPSGKAFYLSNPEWTFIPFNYMYTQRNSDLMAALKKEGFDIEKFGNDHQHTLDEIIKDVKTTNKNGGKIIKNIYNNLEGKINQNSMLLYSGPVQKDKFLRYCLNGYHYCHYYVDNRVACIYTGDSDLNVVEIEDFYQAYWAYVGTIQLPHHGDIKSFNIQILNNGKYFFPVSVGTDNSYGHPSTKVIGSIYGNGSYPVLVTEKSDTMFIEIIV